MSTMLPSPDDEAFVEVVVVGVALDNWVVDGMVVAVVVTADTVVVSGGEVEDSLRTVVPEAVSFVFSSSIDPLPLTSSAAAVRRPTKVTQNAMSTIQLAVGRRRGQFSNLIHPFSRNRAEIKHPICERRHFQVLIRHTPFANIGLNACWLLARLGGSHAHPLIIANRMDERTVRTAAARGVDHTPEQIKNQKYNHTNNHASIGC
jgi:hypothetical protein